MGSTIELPLWLFILILLFAAAPWLPGRSSRAFDPHDPPLDSPTR